MENSPKSPVGWDNTTALLLNAPRNCEQESYLGHIILESPRTQAFWASRAALETYLFSREKHLNPTSSMPTLISVQVGHF
jgi:hypothetical protein